VNLLKLYPTPCSGATRPPAQLSNQPSGDPALVVLDFKPNPAWSPPTMESEPLIGLEGRLWIDPRTRAWSAWKAAHARKSTLAGASSPTSIPRHRHPAAGQRRSQRWIVEHIVEQLNLRALLVKNVHQRLVFDTRTTSPSRHDLQQAIKSCSTPAAHSLTSSSPKWRRTACPSDEFVTMRREK